MNIPLSPGTLLTLSLAVVSYIIFLVAVFKVGRKLKRQYDKDAEKYAGPES